MRALLEFASGVFSGSIYNDGDLLRTLFSGESVADSRVIVVKVHTLQPFLQYGRQKIVFLIRSPFDVIWSHYQLFRTKNHTGVVTRQEFQTGEVRKEFRKFALMTVRKWIGQTRGFFAHARRFPNSSLLVNFRSLHSSEGPEVLASVLDFLDVSQSVYSSRIGCALRTADTPRIHRKSDLQADEVFRSFGGLACAVWNSVVDADDEQILKFLKLQPPDVFPKYGEPRLWCPVPFPTFQVPLRAEGDGDAAADP